MTRGGATSVVCAAVAASSACTLIFDLPDEVVVAGPADAAPADAVPPDAVPPDGTSGACGMIDFEDVLGMVDGRNQTLSTSGTSHVIDDVSFLSSDIMHNRDRKFASLPFTSDYWVLSAASEAGATIEFTSPIAWIRFDYGREAGLTGTFELLADGRTLASFTPSTTAVGQVVADIVPPTIQVNIESFGSSGSLAIDNLEYGPSSCP